MGQAKKVVKVRRRKSINIGFVVFLIVFVYLAANVFMYFTKTHLSIYEVMDGTTADDTIVEGVILRKEKLISTSRAGYINYYQKEGSRVSKKSKLYSIDESKKFYELLENSGDGFQFSSSDIDTVKKEILKFTCNYDKVNYKNVKDFKYNINNTIAEITMEQLMDQAIDQMDKLNFQVVQSKYSGILTYHFDGYEELKAKNVNPDTFNKENYKQEQLRTNDIIAIDSPVCKIVTSEDWQVVTMLSEEQYKKLEEKSKKSSKLKVTILKNDFTTYVPFELTKKDDVYYATLSFDKYMINYLDDRFLDIELHINQAKGYKIPKSAVIKKDFYTVPKTLFALGGDSDRLGLTKEIYNTNGEIESYQFVPTEIYYQDENYYYISTELFEYGNYVRSPETDERYQLKLTSSLNGVYNVNNGYFIFKKIDVLYENESYYIVEKNVENSVSKYDQIALDATKVIEDAIIY